MNGTRKSQLAWLLVVVFSGSLTGCNDSTPARSATTAQATDSNASPPTAENQPSAQRSTIATAYKRLPQGPAWNSAEWNAYYTQDQGSRLIPYAWAKALKLDSGEPFLAGSLARYGYLQNPESPVPGLPAGFLVAEGELSLNCAACHTRQIEAGGQAYRIDGGPALANIGALWADLDAAVARLRNDSSAFSAFAQEVGEAEATLRPKVNAWHIRHHAITEAGLPQPPKNKAWGAGRLDAVGMILNRVTGLDIGKGPSHLIEPNIIMADAPVRPPFLWNAWRQDHTQWPGFADNGDRILALSRNVGQVYGVFGVFHPAPDPAHLLKYNFIDDNSVNFRGLSRLERLIEKIEPPKWPGPIDEALAAKGQSIYMRHTDLKNPGASGCADCHWERPGLPRLLNKNTWCTPVQDVGTDAREYKYFNPKWVVKTGVLEGADIPVLDDFGALKAEDSAVRVLGTSVRGAIAQHHIPILLDAHDTAKARMMLTVLEPLLSKLKNDLKDAYRTPEQMYSRDSRTAVCAGVPATTGVFKYEARVLYGIWAAAPYLHNGSVPTLAELLKPESERVNAFKIGPAYDLVNVGLAAEQGPAATTLETNCERDSGASRCGHQYGTTLAEEDKRALLEYLKKL